MGLLVAMELILLMIGSAILDGAVSLDQLLISRTGIRTRQILEPGIGSKASALHMVFSDQARKRLGLTSAGAPDQLLPRHRDLHVLERRQPRDASLPCTSRRNAGRRGLRWSDPRGRSRCHSLATRLGVGDCAP